MSTWYRINNLNVSVDGDDVEILVTSDNEGNNYIVVSLENILKLKSTNGLDDK